MTSGLFFSQERQPSSERIIGLANASPDATAARSASRIVLIFIAVSQDGLDTSYVMRFWDIFSLATDTKEIGVAAEET